VLKEPEQIMVLAMDIPHNLDRRLELEQGWLVADHSAALINEKAHLVRGQVDVRPRLLYRVERKGRTRWAPWAGRAGSDRGRAPRRAGAAPVALLAQP